MKMSIIFSVVFLISCQKQNKETIQNDTISGNLNTTSEIIDKIKPDNQVSNQSSSNISCNTEVCLQLQNHDAINKSFEIYMTNTTEVAGFQCDLPGIEIKASSGGLLQEHGYNTKNSASRILSFSMEAKMIPVGTGVLTEINYENASNEVCMTEIIFAGLGGTKLLNDQPDCLKLN